MKKKKRVLLAEGNLNYYIVIDIASTQCFLHFAKCYNGKLAMKVKGLISINTGVT